MIFELKGLGKTWIVDIDGTILKHNGHKAGADELLPGVAEFWRDVVRDEDFVVLLSAREPRFEQETLAFLRRAGIRWDKAIFGTPTGERVCINDKKPSGVATSFAVNVARDRGLAAIGRKELWYAADEST